jgi:transmembrane sensor
VLAGGMTAARPVAEREAIAWEVRLRGAVPEPDDLRDFAAWHAVPAHAAAWAALQRQLGRMGGHRVVDAAAMAQALRSPVQDRRRALRAGFTLGTLAFTGWGGLRAFHALGLDADWRSSIGQRGEGRLADGTPVRFDAATRIDLGGGDDAPNLHLRQGQLLVQARRALAVTVGNVVVATDSAQVAAGRFGRRTVVAITGGAATLRIGDGMAGLLEAGQTVHVDGGTVQPSPLSFAAATAWTRGMLVADHLSLPDLLDAFGRYHAGLLRARGAAAGRSISGVFRLSDLDGALRQLAAALPVQVERYGRYLSIVS